MAMNNITLIERREMKHMGYTLKAWYLNPHGVPFHKYFHTGKEMEDFNQKASAVGTKLIGFVSL